MNPAKNIAIN